LHDLICDAVGLLLVAVAGRADVEFCLYGEFALPRRGGGALLFAAWAAAAASATRFALNEKFAWPCNFDRRRERTFRLRVAPLDRRI
jgi:hypothetical protein